MSTIRELRSIPTRELHLHGDAARAVRDFTSFAIVEAAEAMFGYSFRECSLDRLGDLAALAQAREALYVCDPAVDPTEATLRPLSPEMVAALCTVAGELEDRLAADDGSNRDWTRENRAAVLSARRALAAINEAADARDAGGAYGDN